MRDRDHGRVRMKMPCRGSMAQGSALSRCPVLTSERNQRFYDVIQRDARGNILTCVGLSDEFDDGGDAILNQRIHPNPESDCETH